LENGLMTIKHSNWTILWKNQWKSKRNEEWRSQIKEWD